MQFAKHYAGTFAFATRGKARWQNWLAVSVLFVAAAMSLAHLQPQQARARTQPSSNTLHGTAALERLKQDGQYDSLQAAMQRARFSVSPVTHSPLGRAAWYAPNHAAGYDAYVTETGVSLAVKDTPVVGLSLHSLGYGNAWRAITPGQVSGSQQSITIERPGVREWFVNGPDGLEHGFTLNEPPGKRQAGVPLRLALQVSEGWRAVANENEQQVTLRNDAGAAVEYGKLVVQDNQGRNVTARLTVAGEQVVIEVDDQDAVYPLTIDPLFTLQQRLLATDGAAFDYLGYAVALSGNTALVGAPYDEVTHTDQGSAYVFVRNGTNWALQQKLFANDGAPGDKFGSAVALDGDTALIGAPEDDEGAKPEFGAAYVFVRNGATWTTQQKLSASDGLAGALFGAAVALSGQTALVGAPQQTITPSFAVSGAAYIFVRSGAVWTQQQRLLSNDIEDGDSFGVSVALDGDTALVGAPNNAVTVGGQGAAYIFTRSGATQPIWTQQPRLTANTPALDDHFGNAVALSGDKALIGAYLYGSDDRGAVYAFRRSATGWAQTDTALAPNPTAGAHFGVSVALRGDTAVIGASLGLVQQGVDRRSAYVYMFLSDPEPVRQLGPELGSANDGFGYAVALDGDTVLVGAYRTDATVTDQGAAYAFVLHDSRHAEQQKLFANDGATDDSFGQAVALDGDTVAVGASADDIGTNIDQGSVYVFTRNSTGQPQWTFQQKLTANDGVAGNGFGYAVALSGDMLVVGPRLDAASANQGVVYVFTRSGTTQPIWTQQPKLYANDGARDDFFGRTVALSGDTLAVGAIGANADKGAVYVFARNGAGWAFRQTFIANDGAPGDEFGYAVALDGDAVTVGAWRDTIGTNAAQGSAYVFTRNGTTWAFQQKLTANDGASVDFFGAAVALSGDTLAVGAPSATIGANSQQGAAYVFVRTGTLWTQLPKFTANDGRARDNFGSALALNGGLLVVGARLGKTSTNSDQGAAYVYTYAGAWHFQQKLMASDGESGDAFGGALAISGATLVMGASGDNLGTINNQGSVYVFASPACPALTLNPVSLPNGMLNAAYDQTITLSGVTVSGDNLVTVSAGALPPGLRLDKENDRDGRLRGTPTVPGTYRFTLALTPILSGCPGSRSYTLTITPPCPTITLNPPTLPGAEVGVSYSQTLTASGGTPGYSFSVNPLELPRGLTLSANGTLSGTPASGYGGGFTVTATDANGCRGTRLYSFTVNARPTITALSVNARQGSPASQQVIASVQDNQFTDTLSYTINGGASATVNGVTVGNLSATRFGVLSANVVATCAATNASFTLTVTDDLGATASATLNITVASNSAPTLSYANPSVAVGGTLSINPATGPSDNGSVASITMQSAGTFTGSLSVNNTTGVINVSNAQPGGSHTITIRATDNCGATRDATFTLSVNCPAITLDPAPAGGMLPGGTTGVSYQQTITATGGVAPYQFSVSAGALPVGLSLSTGGGLTGTPGASGVFNFTVNATDANGCAGTRAYTLTISPGGGGATGLQFYPLAQPIRLLDTRPGQIGCDAPSAPIGGGTARTQTAAGRSCGGLTIPANAKALTGNLTTVESGGGYLTLYPSDTAQPLVANTNYAPNEVLNNVFTVGLGAGDGAFKIFAVNDTHVVVDVTGYYAPPSASGLYFHPLPKPVRLLDTRPGMQACFTPGAPLPQGSNTPQLGQTTCDGVVIPAGARALVGNATTVNPQNFGYLTLYPADAAQPLVASSNFTAGQVMNAPFTVGLAPSGFLNIFTTATTDLVVDVLGYYSTDANDVNGAGLLFNPLPAPVRLLETRAGLSGCSVPGAPLSAATPYTQIATGTCVSIPPTARGIIGNATVVNAQAGYLTFWPSNAAQPLVANSNYQTGQVFNRHFTVGLGTDGAFKLFASGQTDLVLDVAGYFAP